LTHLPLQFADQLAKYREDPAAFGSDAEEEEESSSSSESEEGSGAEDEGEERVDKRIGARPARGHKAFAWAAVRGAAAAAGSDGHGSALGGSCSAS
jgi:hypothetical protein